MVAHIDTPHLLAAGTRNEADEADIRPQETFSDPNQAKQCKYNYLVRPKNRSAYVSLDNYVGSAASE